VGRLVIDLRAGTVIHLVVSDRQFRGRLAPLSLVDVDAATGTIRLRCTIVEFGKLGPAVRSSRGVQLSPMPASVQTRLNILRTLPASRVALRWVVNTSGVLPVFPGREPLVGLAAGPGTQRLDCRCGEGEGAAGRFGLGLAVRAH
jgi:hypothetical protein